jgi:SAM-dependent methyltransferase
MVRRDFLSAVLSMSRSADSSVPLPEVADQVQDFYDRYPYPPPVGSLDRYRRAWQDPQKRRADYHLFWPDRAYREDYSILVAGCGTSQAAKHAVRWPAARVTGIDVSETSIRCTEELKRKHNLTNLELRRLPLDGVSKLQSSFDQIVCTGVLHHLEDPDAGLAALRAVLKPHGAMHLMLYAPYGRAGIYMLQEFCRRVGIRPTNEGIGDLVSSLQALPPEHPLSAVLRDAPDFRQTAALADALLHPQDRAYSVPQLFEFFERAGLSFGRWVKQAPYSSQCGVMAHLPRTLRLAELSPAEEYAAAELFRGTMVRHSVVVYRDDSPSLKRPLSFAGDSWLGYVGIRMSETICVQDRLPSSVLINQNHTYKDLLMRINEVEKMMFDAIDGNRSIGEIVQKISSGQEDARAFFERLWWHDQVVFDASRS